MILKIEKYFNSSLDDFNKERNGQKNACVPGVFQKLSFID